MNIQWLNSSNHTLHSYTGLNDYTEHTLNYTISNVKLSDAGQYKCSFFVSPVNSLYIINSIAKTNSTTINVISKLHSYCIINDLWIISLIVPISRSLLLVSSLSSYIEFGNNVTLTCRVTSNHTDFKMRTKVNIKWSKDQNTSTLESDSWTSYEYDRNFPLFLNNVKLSDAGKYNCSYYLTSANDNPYVKSSVVAIGVTNVTVKSKFMVCGFLFLKVFTVSNDVKPTIIPLKVSPLVVGSNITLSCYVHYSRFDISTNANLQWFDSFGKHLKSFSNSYTLNNTISNIKLSNAGQYNCLFNINTTRPHPYILSSKNTTAAIVISVISKLIKMCTVHYYFI